MASASAQSGSQRLAAAGRAQPVKLLLVEERDEDARLVVLELGRHGFAPAHRRVATPEELAAALRAEAWDAVISDFTLPGLDVFAALAAVQDSGHDLPFIVVSGTTSEEAAVAALRAGAHDFVLTSNLARLAPALARELREAALRADQRRLQEQLLAADRLASVGLLAAGVAHEINNPLAAVIANLEVMHDRLGALERTDRRFDEIVEACADATEAAERVRQIVRDVRVFSRQADDRRRPVDVHRVLETTLRIAWGQIRHRARVVRDFKETRRVLATEARLGQVFLNLIVNAAQSFGDRPSEQNRIGLATRASGDRVVVEVSDNGPGIPAEVQSEIFAGFFTTKPAASGTGLGLSICRKIVDGLGGRISVESAVGAGARFTVELPATDLPAAPAPSSASLPAFGGRRGRVLVVDDEVLITNAVRRALAPEHDVAVAFSANDALDRLRAGERFDLILCDLLMPSVSGMALHDHLRRTVPEQADRMVFMTGNASNDLSARFLNDFPDRQIDKPFDTVALRALARQWAR